MTKPTVAVVVLSMGNRPTELARALAALERQQGVDMDVVLLGNGWVPVDVPDWVRTIHSPENLGVIGGRNRGADEARGEFIFFYDDDGEIIDEDMLARMVGLMDDDVAVVQPRGIDYDGRPSPRRWTPRLVTSRPDEGGDVPVFWEAMAMIRRNAFEEAGQWGPAEFMFGHEGIDLSMRLLDRGWRIRFEPALVVRHPAHPPSRHDHHFYTTARNRAWVARRNLPAVLVPLYLGVWALATIARVRTPSKIGIWFRGLRDGLKGSVPGGRKPIAWRTVWQMTKLGRPPLW